MKTRFPTLATALLVGCWACTQTTGSTAPPPATLDLTLGEATLSIRASEAGMTLRRGDTTLWELGTDGLELGTQTSRDPSASLDPYWLEETSDAFAPDPPVDLVFHPLTSWKASRLASGAVSVEAGFADGARTTLELSVADGRVKGVWKVVSEGSGSLVNYLRVRVATTETEGLYGLGGWMDEVNHRGKLRPTQMEVDLSLESANNELHEPVPLLISTRGWGIFVESLRLGVFDVAKTRADRVSFTYGLGEDALGAGLTFHLMQAQEPLSLVGQYHALTGAPRMPAPWAYGPWIWRDENRDQAEVLDDVATLRALDLPTSGMWIDRPYASAVNTFDFKPSQFPDPPAMVAAMHAAGLQVALWHVPYLSESAPALRQEATERGYFPTRTATLLNSWGKPLDFTQEAARTWWQGLLRRYTDLGVVGFKLDYAEDVLPALYLTRNEWLFADGSDDRTMHHRYTVLYHQVYDELLPEDGGFLLCRAGRWGSQRHTSIIWPGDLDATFTRHREVFTNREGQSVNGVGGMAASVAMMVNLSASGFPFYAADTGGYRHSPPSKELFIRWAQQTAFSAVMQVGDSSSQPPWEFTPENGRDQEAVDIYRTYARWHLRLFPYVWTLAQRMADTGLPIIRPVGLAYPEAGVHPSDEYLLGADILVAPILQEGARQRDVFLPSGNWVDFHSGQLHAGGSTITAAAPLDTMPLYVREGALIPMLSPTMDTLSPATDPAVESFANDAGLLWTRLVPGGQTTGFTLYDGTLLGSADRQVLVGSGAVFTAGHMLEIIRTPEPEAVALDRVPLDRVADAEALDAVSQGWFHTAERGGTLWVKVPGGPMKSVTW